MTTLDPTTPQTSKDDEDDDIDHDGDSSRNSYHITVTGLQIKSWRKLPAFVRFARRSMIQAKAAPGVVLAIGTYRQGIHHTLSVWQDNDAMQAYMRSGPHRGAMAISRDIGSMVKVYGYDSDKIPSMEEAIELWQQHGRVVFREEEANYAAAGGRIMESSCRAVVQWSDFVLVVLFILGVLLVLYG